MPTPIPRPLHRRLPVMALCLGLLAACAGGTSGSDTTKPTGAAASTLESTTPTSEAASTSAALASLDVVAGEQFPEARCAANRAAGPIVYLSGFDFAATASIVDVLVADALGYYDALCLDVDIRPSFSVDNYPLVAANDAQFASAGSFSEMVDFAGANDAGFVALGVEGRTGIDALLVKKGVASTLDDLEGATIGVKGAVTTSVRAMLASAGLFEGEGYETVLLDGFDPLAHIAAPGIAGFPVYKSNEPGRLRAAGVEFDLFDPSDYGIPGSFGVLYTNTTFLAEHPTAAQDFMRATMKGLRYAIDNPADASAIAVEAINAGDNALYLTAEGESARWAVDAELLAERVTDDEPLGLPIPGLLAAEVEDYARVGLFGGTAPDIASMVDASVVAGIYDGANLIWPADG
ncbi:MAG: ABC transporter substrate-binding protein [Ilumatobacteraceae bacterium]